MAEYSARSLDFDCTGLDLTSGVDRTRQGKFPLLRNLRGSKHGRLIPRRGLTYLDGGISGTAHSMAKVVDKSSGSTVRGIFVGHGTTLRFSANNGSTWAAASTGWSGNPLSFATHRPSQAVEPWLYVGDSAKIRKYNVSGTEHRIGLPTPTDPPNVYLDIPAYVHHPFIESSTAGWTAWGKYPNNTDIGADTAPWHPEGGAGMAALILDTTWATRATLTVPTATWRYDVGGASPTAGSWVVAAVTQSVFPSPTSGGNITETNKPSQIGPGTVLTDSATFAGITRRFIVQEVYAATRAATVKTCIYDSVSLDLASVAFTDPLDDLKVGALVKATNGVLTIYGRVLNTAAGSDGKKSARFDFTWSASSHSVAAGWTIEQLASIRFFDKDGTRYGTLYSYDMRIAIGDSGQMYTYSATTAMDFTTATKSIAGAGTTDTVPIGPDDYIHFSFYCSQPNKVKEVKITFALDQQYGGTGSPTSDYNFNKNAYFVAFKGADLAAAAGGTTTVGDVTKPDNPTDPDAEPPRPPRLGPRTIEPGDGPTINDPNNPNYDPTPAGGLPGQGGTGDTNPSGSIGGEQWREVFVRVRNLTRLGEDKSKTLKDIVATKIDVTTVDIDYAQVSAGSPVYSKPVYVQIGSIWAGGGYATDIGPATKRVGQPYYYRYRFRSTLTGAKSNFSPPFRGGVMPERQAVRVQMSQSALTEVDKIDIERFGGVLTGWNYVATVDNPAGGGGQTNYIDKVSDITAAGNAAYSEGNINYQPFPIVGKKVTGTLTAVAGTTVTSSAAFSTSWAPGTVIKLYNTYTGTTEAVGEPYQIYRVIDTSTMELYSSAGAGGPTGSTAMKFVIEEPVLEGQPLPIIFGPYENHFFALGDIYNPGRLYHTRGNNPDSSMPEFSIDITDPADPLQNGGIWNGRAYVWSTTRLYQLLPTPGDVQRFRAIEIPGGRGLADRWALAFGPAMMWLDRDGIYASMGGPAECISDEIKRIFPVAGTVGTTINALGSIEGIPCSDIDTPGHRLSWGQGHLAYSYPKQGGGTGYGYLIRDMTEQDGSRHGWWYDNYADNFNKPRGYYADPEDSESTLFLYGGVNATSRLYEVSGYTDNSEAFQVAFLTPFTEGDGTRNEKRWGDAVVEFNGDGSTITFETYTDYSTSGASVTPNDSGNTLTVIDQGSGSGVWGRNIGLLGYTNSASNATLEFLRWEPSWIPYPEDILRRGTDFYDQGKACRKYVRGVIIEADTQNAAITFDILKDLGAVSQTLAITHNGRHMFEYGLTPFSTALLSLRPQANNGLKLFKHIWIYDPYPFITTTPTPWDDLGDMRAKFVQGVRLNADTGGSAVTLDIQKDGGTSAITLSGVNHSGQIIKAYPTDGATWEPFITHQVRIVPAGNIGIFKAEWVWEPEPELATQWEGQETTFDGRSWLHLRDMWLSMMLANSTQSVTVEITADNTNYTYTVTGDGSGLLQKLYVPLQPIKAKQFRFELTSSLGFRLYVKNCEVRYKHWGDGGPYRVALPFGDESRAAGARI